MVDPEPSGAAVIALLLATQLFAASFEESAGDRQVVNFDTPIYVNQLSTIDVTELECAGAKVKFTATVHVGHYVDTVDGFQEFTGRFDARGTADGKTHSIGRSVKGEATFQVDANITAANSLARSTGDFARARVLLYDGRVTSLLLNDRARALSVNIADPRPWKVRSFEAKQLTLEGDDMSLEVSNTLPVLEKKPPVRLFRGLAKCRLKIKFVDL